MIISSKINYKEYSFVKRRIKAQPGFITDKKGITRRTMPKVKTIIKNFMATNKVYVNNYIQIILSFLLI